MSQLALVLIRPEAVEAGLVPELLTRLQKQTDLKLVGMKMLRLLRHQVEILVEHRNWTQIQSGTWCSKLYGQAGVAMVFEGENSQQIVAEAVGSLVSTDTRTIRGSYPANPIELPITPSETGKWIVTFFHPARELMTDTSPWPVS